MDIKTAHDYKLNKFVFAVSSLSILVLATLTIVAPSASSVWLEKIQSFMAYAFSWYYMALLSSCLIFTLWLAISPYGNIKLGPKEELPEHSYMSWIFMLFSAGIGIAMLYYGCYEPVEHFYHPPTGPAQTAEAAQYAMVLTFLHWGLHGWSIYALVGVVISYFAYVKNYRLEMRAPLYILFGEKLTNGSIGNLTDCFTIIATITAMVTNLGIGALVCKAGLIELFNLQDNLLNLTILLIVMSACAAAVAAMGIDKGIAIISKFNIYALCALLLYVLLIGHTAHLLDSMVQNIGDYINNFIHLSFNLYLYQKALAWRGLWTIFYWAWWVSWAPFVGMFIAKISKGRTIRELICGVLIIPLIFTLAWLCIFGNSTLYLIIIQNATGLGTQILAHPEMAMYDFLKYLPLAKLMIGIATVVSFILFFAPVDSGCLMISDLALLQNRNITEEDSANSPIWLRIFWCFLTCIVSIGLFFAGNFMAIQTIVVLCALPCSLIIPAYIISLIKVLKTH
ncbi:BCCT family transporter [Bartonella sp. TP]|uniref:BCCT family transporter n=1 Tax=Bartonella sp. TP TaxID=3057550 RepID=UPI0025B144A6|nr:BCCT family transporter [Bartonella sp. TP]WJW80226.1 BCCT family transporter [Bartonella sp. TP]